MSPKLLAFFAVRPGAGERMKTLGLRTCILIFAAAIFFVRTGLSEESNGFWPLSGEFSADLTYVGEGDVERGGKHVNNFDEIDSEIRAVLTPRFKLGVLRLGAQWERFSFGLPNGAALPNTLQSFSTIIGLDTQLSDSILIRAETQPGLYNSGLGHLFWDNFDMPFVVGGTYIFSPNLQLILGVSVDVERRYPVIPAAGVRWKIGPQWLLDAVMPTPRLQYQLNRDVSLYAGATITEATFRTDDEVGDQPYRDFDCFRAEVRYHQDGGAPYGTISLHGAF